MSLASKNPFASLGNDEEEEKNTLPVRTVDKKTAGTTKRGVEPQAPTRGPGAGGNRRGGGIGGNEGAFRDRGAGSDRNHGRSTEEAPRGGARGGYGARVRGGRGSRRPRDQDDRHPSKYGGPGGSEKQAGLAWGQTEGEAEMKDEQAGEAIAQSEQKEALAEDAAGDEPAEPEDKSISFADYQAQQAEKKAGLDAGLKTRAANEGAKVDKKWSTLEKEEEDYFAASGGKAKRERERKVKQTIDFDPRFVEPERGSRGGRGGPRGGRGGESRGGRGGERGARGGRGGERGSGERGRGFRGGPRGGRDNAAPINTADKSAFPTLGGGK